MRAQDSLRYGCRVCFESHGSVNLRKSACHFRDELLLTLCRDSEKASGRLQRIACGTVQYAAWHYNMAFLALWSLSDTQLCLEELWGFVEIGGGSMAQGILERILHDESSMRSRTMPEF